MYIDKIKIRNFRLLNDTVLNFKTNLNLLIGRNNTGKTSFLVLFDRFYNQSKFDYNDFSLPLREALDTISGNTDFTKLVIQMILEIQYDVNDNLEHLSDFILDLDPKENKVKILFECKINAAKLLEALKSVSSEQRKHYIEKNLSSFLEQKIYTYLDDTDLENENRHRLVEKELKLIKALINLQIIQAKREVASSEENNNRKVLSSLTTKYFNNNDINPTVKFEQINGLMSKMDDNLTPKYASFFEGFLKNAKEFLNLKDLKVISNLQSKELLENSSEVVYGAENSHLPENLNGLGCMNILYLLLTIEIRKATLISAKQDINLLFIEEPEAHTHPQLQYIFARKIKSILSDIPHLQTIITTHSSHIVSQCDFKDIRYLMKQNDGEISQNIVIKNFYDELHEIYEDKKEFDFLKQYLTIQSAELFFASKIIFIEGISEQILLPYFIDKFDKSHSENDADYTPLSAQNVSVVEAGANAKAFKPFIDFLQIKTLIITDLDTVKSEVKKNKKGNDQRSYPACPVCDSKCCSTSNATLKYYFDSPEITKPEHLVWINSLKQGALTCISDNVKIAYQKEEKGYQARSFEDAFININLNALQKLKNDLRGLKNCEELDINSDIYILTQNIIDKKSDFASSLLYLALTEKTAKWEIPLYIQEGLEWILN